MKRLFPFIFGPFLAIQFLTRIPITFLPKNIYSIPESSRWSFPFFPLVGALTGLLVGGSILICRLHLPWVASSVIGLLLGCIVTGCFHEDGFADTADSFGAYKKDDALRIMRDSRIGTFGAVALWGLLSLKLSLLCAFPSAKMIALVVCSQTLGRFSSLPLALFMPYARDTNGQGATLTSQIRLGDLFLGAVIAIAVALWQVGMRGCVIDMVVCLLVTFLCGLVFRQKFGGVTGDCLGAANQCVELAILCLPLFT